MKGEIYIQLAASISAVILVGIAIFQILLFLGFPLGEYSWGGRYTGVLPRMYRWLSLLAAILLVFMCLILLIDTDVLSIPFFGLSRLVGGMTVFLGMNTLGNAASKNRKERLIMTPLSGICFLSCLAVSLFGN